MQGHDSWTHDSCELDHAPRETVGVRGETERVMADAMPMAYKTVQYVPGSSSSVAPLPLALALSLHSRTVRSIEHREMQSGGGPNSTPSSDVVYFTLTTLRVSSHDRCATARTHQTELALTLLEGGLSLLSIIIIPCIVLIRFELAAVEHVYSIAYFAIA